MASTGTLPDAVIGEAYLDSNYELFAPLDVLIDQYAPHVAARIAEREDYQRALKSPDGKIHALPNGDESTQIRIPTHTWINKAWLDKLGLDMPTNTEELKEVLIAFRDEDPNGNGIADEIPFAFETTAPLFSGDVLFNGSIGRFDFPNSSKYDTLTSIEKIKTFNFDATLYPGHGPSSTLKSELLSNPYLQKS